MIRFGESGSLEPSQISTVYPWRTLPASQPEVSVRSLSLSFEVLVWIQCSQSSVLGIQTAAWLPLTLAASATVSDGPPRPPPNLFHVEQAKPHPLLQSIKLKLLNGSFRMSTNPSRWEQVVDHHIAHHEPNVSHVLKPILIPNPVVQKAAAVLLAFRS